MIITCTNGTPLGMEQKNKNIKSEQSACLSDTPQLQRNLSRQNTLRGEIEAFRDNWKKIKKMIKTYWRVFQDTK